MTVKDEIERIMRRNGLRHVSASILDDGTFRVSTYRREYTSYYMRHLEERREYGRNYYWKNREYIRKYQHEYYMRRRYGTSHYGGNDSNTLDHKKLAKAIVYAYSLKGIDIPMGDAVEISLHALSFFGYETRILSNTMERDDLVIMYTLEDLGLLRAESEEIPLGRNNKPWTISYFSLNRERILEYASVSREGKPVSEPSSVYENLPEEVWAR
jgi:hypothetical protein